MNGAIIPNNSKSTITITPSNNAEFVGKRVGNVCYINIATTGSAVNTGWTTIGQLTNSHDYPAENVTATILNTSLNSVGYVQINTSGLIRVYQSLVQGFVGAASNITYII